MLVKHIPTVAASVLVAQLSHSALVQEAPFGSSGSQSSLTLFLFNDNGAFVVDTGLLYSDIAKECCQPTFEIELSSLPEYSFFGQADSFALLAIADYMIGDAAYSYNEFAYYDPSLGFLYADSEQDIDAYRDELILEQRGPSVQEQIHFENLRGMIGQEGYIPAFDTSVFSGFYSIPELNQGQPEQWFFNLIHPAGE